MFNVIDTAWIIPSLPFFAAIFVGGLLISFNRTMNRLTKPISFILIISILISTSLSFFINQKHLSGEFTLWDLSFIEKNFSIVISVNELTSLVSLLAGIIFLIVMTYSYYSLPRSKGYVRYMTILALLNGIIIFFSFSGGPFDHFIETSRALFSKASL